MRETMIEWLNGYVGGRTRKVHGMLLLKYPLRKNKKGRETIALR
jgi:hypothetical protein